MQLPSSHRRFRSESMEPGGRNGPSCADIVPLKKPALEHFPAAAGAPAAASSANESAVIVVHQPTPPDFPIGHKETLALADSNAARLGADLIHDTLEALPVKPLQIVQTARPEVQCSLVGRTATGETVVDMKVVHSFRANYNTELILAARLRQEEEGVIERPPEVDHLHTGPDGLPYRRGHQMYLSDIADDERIDDGEETACIVPYTGRDGEGKCIEGNCEWMVDASKVFLSRRLAVGGFAEVFLGQYEGTRVAVKRLLSQANQEEFRKEVRMFAHLRHPNLLLFMGYTIQPTLSIITEYMQRGSLFSILSKRKAPLEPKLQKSVALSVARGMTYLHSREPPILHLDLKSANILVDNSWKVKLGDFGLSQIRTNTFMSSAASAGGTPQWMAPEVLRSERYGEAADVYSFGVVLWEVITGKAPWEDMHPMQVVGAVGFQGRMLPMPTDPEADPALVEMAMWCMNHNPARRPTFRTIVDALDAKFNHQPHEPNSETLTDHVKARLEHDLSMESDLSHVNLSGSSDRTGQSGGGTGSSGQPQPTAMDIGSPFAASPAASPAAEPQPKLYGLYRVPSVPGQHQDGAVGTAAPGPGPGSNPPWAGASAQAVARAPSIVSPFAAVDSPFSVAVAPRPPLPQRVPSMVSPFAAFTEVSKPPPAGLANNADLIEGDPRSSAVSINTVSSSEPALPATPGREEYEDGRPLVDISAAGLTSATSSSSFQSASSTSSSLSSPSSATLPASRLQMPSMVAFFAAERSCCGGGKGGHGGKGLPRGGPGRCHFSKKGRSAPTSVDTSMLNVEAISVEVDNMDLVSVDDVGHTSCASPCKLKRALEAMRAGWSCRARA